MLPLRLPLSGDVWTVLAGEEAGGAAYVDSGSTTQRVTQNNDAAAMLRKAGWGVPEVLMLTARSIGLALSANGNATGRKRKTGLACPSIHVARSTFRRL